MRSRILTGAAALTFATSIGLMATAPASAQSWQGNRGNIAADLAAGVVDGALATATLPFWATGYYGYYDGYYPGYIHGPGYAYTPEYNYVPEYTPLYGYYGGYDLSPWSYRGGPHPH
jgi:hypothetical protein